MTDPNTRQAFDKRLWAALLIAFFISFAATYNNRTLEAPPISSLAIRGDELYLAKGLATPAIESKYVAEVTDARFVPFFFAPVPINRADKSLLMTLPGIGRGLAERIISYRDEYGPIADEAQFSQVKGIGRKRIESLRYAISFM